jgi:hypothetical protein
MGCCDRIMLFPEDQGWEIFMESVSGFSSDFTIDRDDNRVSEERDFSFD